MEQNANIQPTPTTVSIPLSSKKVFLLPSVLFVGFLIAVVVLFFYSQTTGQLHQTASQAQTIEQKNSNTAEIPTIAPTGYENPFSPTNQTEDASQYQNPFQ